MGRELDEGLQEHRLGQVPRLQALVVQQARQPLRRGFLIAKAASQLGLTAGLLDNNPTTLLDLALGLTPLSMRQIGAVIAPLSPGK